MAPVENDASVSSLDLGISSLHAQYQAGTLTPHELIRRQVQRSRIASGMQGISHAAHQESQKLRAAAHAVSLYPSWSSSGPIFIHLATLEQLLKQADALMSIPAQSRGPLWGIPCAVKDNIDVAGMPTTAACPAFTFHPTDSSVGVKAIQDAGVIIVGKTNMDQFAAGLVGTRSPYGACSTPFDPRFISGGSSSGSGAAVGGGLVSFALGTDTAGSGRVPAGFCGCVGIKGTVGSISTVGVVPASASLDCLTVFSRTVEDGAAVIRIMRAQHAGAEDAWRRTPPAVVPQLPAVGFRFAVPKLGPADWSSPGGPQAAAAAAAAFDKAIARLQLLGGVQVDIDMSPFQNVAAMLYTSAILAERYSGIRGFLELASKRFSKELTSNTAAAMMQHPLNVAADERLLPVTRTIISGAAKYSAVDVYDANAQLARHRAAASAALDQVDMLLVPTALAHYTVQEIQSEEACTNPKWTQNANLGRFTNFVNLLDMCGVAVPAGVLQLDARTAVQEAEAAAASGQLREDQLQQVKNRAAHLHATGSTEVTLPFGVTLLTRAWQDEWLWGVGAAMHRASGLGCGPVGHQPAGDNGNPQFKQWEV